MQRLAFAALALASVAADPVDTAIKQVMARMHVPGMAVVVVRDGRVIKEASYGEASVEHKVPVGPDTRFQIASATKVLTGTLVMLLVQDGKLALDAPVARYLPDAPPAWRTITIGHLAAHAAGIPDKADPAATTLDQVTASLAKQPLAFAPGAKAQYGLSDVAVLTRVLEKVSGMAFEELLRARIGKPAGFGCSAFEHAIDDGPTRRADLIPHAVGVYRWEGDHQRTAWYFYKEWTYSQGGLFACPRDLASWAIAMDSGKLLTPASEQRAATPFRLTDGTDGGFGVVFTTGSVRGHRAYGHSGGPALADIIRVPDQKLTVIVLANSKSLYPNLAPLLAQLYVPAKPQPPALRDAPELRVQLEKIDPALIAGLPPLGRIELIEDKASTKRYRATYGKFVIVWKLGADGKLEQEL